jgi:hypothetical protein
MAYLIYYEPPMPDMLCGSLVTYTVIAGLFFFPSAYFGFTPVSTIPAIIIITVCWIYISTWAAAVFSILRYIPQIIYTYRLKRVGSLSMTAMSIQIPLLLLEGLSLHMRFARARSGGLSTYYGYLNFTINCIIIAGEEAALLWMCAHYTLLRRTTEEARAADNDVENTIVSIDERQPLLQADNAESIRGTRDTRD